jgi:molybdopterin-guanine dinucleotide biosynthesis protein A
MAGGKSSRMGVNKAFVELHGKPLIGHVLDRVSDLEQEETILIANSPADYDHLGLPVYPDLIPGKGSLGGIYSAIHDSRSQYTLVVACDMPLLNPDLLRYMIGLCSGPVDVIAPRVEGHPQGLHAIYSKDCLEPIHRQLDAGRLKVIGFHQDVRVRYLDEPEYGRFDPNGLSFFNVNTPQDLKKVSEL